MATKLLPPAEYLRECFSYDTSTGYLWWKERPREHFKTDYRWQIGNKYCAGRRAGRPGQGRYISVTIDGESHRQHRIIWKMLTGSEPSEIDHINRNGLDNTWANLREATRHENVSNRAFKPNKYGLRGVSKSTNNSRRFVARIMHNRKKIHLGSFDTPEEAHAVYCKAAQDLWGEFCCVD